jgi:hypothetical protein
MSVHETSSIRTIDKIGKQTLEEKEEIGKQTLEEKDNEPGLNPTIITSSDIPNVIDENYKMEIKGFLQSRATWRTIGMSMETISKIMLGVSSILAFATSIYPCNTNLSFASGSVSTLSLVFLQFANFSFRESKLSTNNLNVLLQKLHEEPVPELQGSILKSSPVSETPNDIKLV